MCVLNFLALEAWIEEEMRTRHVPGLAVAVIQEGELVYARGFGVTGLGEQAVPVTADTLFRVGSVTKQMTAILILRLVEAGLLNLDRPVIDYLPEFRLSDAQATEAVTLRLLLAHSSGLINQADHYGSRDPQGLRRYVLHEIPKLPVWYAPGQVFSYSNNNYNIAGLVAETVTGRSYDDLMQEYVFDALEMSRTTFDPLRAMGLGLAMPVMRGRDGEWSPLPVFPENTANHPSFFAMSSVRDLAHLALFHMNRGQFGGRQVVRADLVDEMHRPQQRNYYASQLAAGLGIFSNVRKGVPLLTHFGDISSYSADIITVPTHKAAVIVVNNNEFPIYDILYKVLDQLVPGTEATGESDAPTEDHELWQRLAGVYYGPFCGQVEIAVEEEELILRQNGTRRALRRQRDDLYACLDEEGTHVATLGVVANEGDIEIVTVNNNFAKRLNRAPEGWEPTVEQLSAYTGTYAHHEIVSCEITSQEGRLSVTDEHGTVELVPYREHLFLHPHFGTYLFEVGADGQAERLLWSHFLPMKRRETA